MTEKISLSDIVKSFESRWFMSVMSTGAIAVLTQLIAVKFGYESLKLISTLLTFLSIGLFAIVAFVFIVRVIKFKDEIVKDLKHPIAANFFAGINISAAVVATAILNVLIPNNALPTELALDMATVFYFTALAVGIAILVIVPVMLITSKQVDSKHAIGIWFLPPVGMFVIVFAGNFLGMHGVLTDFIAHLNIFIFGVAFMLYFLVLNLIYYRLKFHPLPAPEVAPSFVIGLAPIGVSAIAVKTYVMLLAHTHTVLFSIPLLQDIADIYTVLIYGFGFWWFAITFVILTYYIIKHSIPYSLGYWAFVFPVAAFGIGLKFLSDISSFGFTEYIMYAIWALAAGLWTFVFLFTIKSIINKKAFIRPKVVK